MDRTSINRSLDKAHDQARAGNLPTLVAAELLRDSIHETWRVLSRTTDGVAYTVDLLHGRAGIETQCDCPAAAAERLCWHRGAARLAHQDAITSRNLTGYRIRPKAQPTSRLPHFQTLKHISLTGRH
jgi:hypothetical protein